MIIEYYMSKNVIVCNSDTKIFDAVDQMKKHKIHRLPVVENGELIGLITEGVIQTAMPSTATSLSVYEVNYLLNKTTVSDIMIPKNEVCVIQPQSLLEEGIQLMRKRDVGVLPVINEQNQVIGIITNNDIFDAFLEITGFNDSGTRITLSIAHDQKGVLADITQLLSTHNYSIVQIVVYRKTTSPVIVIQLNEPDCKNVQNLLNEQNYTVLDCRETLADK